MLILKTIDQKTAEGKWFDREVWGAVIRIKIKPRTEAIVKNIRKKFKHIKNENEREEAILQELVDYVIEDFDGVGDSPQHPLEPTRANKLRVWKIDVPLGEQPLSAWILDRANEMAVEVTEEDVKNSERSPVGATE